MASRRLPSVVVDLLVVLGKLKRLALLLGRWWFASFGLFSSYPLRELRDTTGSSGLRWRSFGGAYKLPQSYRGRNDSLISEPVIRVPLGKLTILSVSY